MAHARKLAVSGLNVRIVDQEKRDYPALFQAILRARRSVAVRGTDHLIFTAFGRAVGSSRIEYSGVIGKYTDIPEDADWLDTVNLVAAEEDRLEEIVIPPDLKPNYEAFFCALFPREHILAFESFSDSRPLSPRYVEKWLSTVVNLPAIKGRFGDIEVDLIPDYDVVDRILSSDRIREISITIKRTNPDDYDLAAFEEAEQRLQRLNAEREKLTYVAPRQEFLDLDEQTKTVARVGAENGVVDARILEDGTILPVSTREHPIEVQDQYDPDDILGEVFFRSLAIKLLGLVQRNRRGDGTQ